jgi:head-tail adaptor
MRAGALKYKLTLLEPQRTTDRMGAEAVQYIETSTVWAERVNTAGNRSEEVGEHFAAYGARFNIRDAHRVAENWRVRQLGGYLYTVVAIVPNLDRGYKTLICDRVNE